jgi:hypothetical protein
VALVAAHPSQQLLGWAVCRRGVPLRPAMRDQATLEALVAFASELATFAALPDLVLALFGASTDPRCAMMLTTHRVYHSGVALTWSPVINQALAARRRADLRHTLLCRRRA